MAANNPDILRYRRDAAAKGEVLSAHEREEIIKKYLPTPRTRSTEADTDSSGSSTTKRRSRKRRIRPFIKSKIHFLVYFLIQLVFGIFIRVRKILHATSDRIIAVLHYHHRTPEYIQKDVKNLSRLPEHLSVILKFKSEEDGGIEALMDEVAELCAWSAAAGIPVLSVYEKSGILKSYMSSLREIITLKLEAYFGASTNCPALYLHAPNYPSLPSTTNTNTPSRNGISTTGAVQPPSRQRLNLLLLSATDGRDTLVDLTRTLTEMSQSQKIRPKDITLDLINAEISATTSIPDSYINAQSTNGHDPASPSLPNQTPQKDTEGSEPDLLIVFGPYVKLDGYPPWQIRLTEIFCTGDSGAEVSGSYARVEYQGFLRALWKFAGAEMRFGR